MAFIALQTEALLLDDRLRKLKFDKKQAIHLVTDAGSRMLCEHRIVGMFYIPGEPQDWGMFYISEQSRSCSTDTYFGTTDSDRATCPHCLVEWWMMGKPDLMPFVAG
jgi:hypothetical protein